ncbi:hypothetical protein [Nostoc sp. WHI]|uniref:hypothetical protein n=1 Tax=Nostoc sp. WHI TaxID=2650611 RepID=UPI0018C47D6C|nr:hypothetical protein [Nostoc sp. WHI]MBG1267408.1 hypothetical protein [Nostoc sp. WHI]
MLYAQLAVQDNQNKITLEQAVIVLACFVGNTEILVTVNRESGNFYKLSDKMLFNNMSYYDILFNNSVSGIKLCRYVNIFQYLDQIFTTSEQDVQEIRRKYFYQHGKFFILYILSKRHKVLFDKPEIAMSQEDKAELSQIGLELAEFIYNVAESLFRNVYKEYRDIFNNLNDIENLDRVIQELERGDAPAANPNIPTA